REGRRDRVVRGRGLLRHRPGRPGHRRCHAAGPWPARRGQPDPGPELAPRLQEASGYGCLMAPRVALVGCGRWGVHVLRDLLALGCEVVVVARSEASRERAEEGGATAVVPAIRDLTGVEGAVVVTPTTTHAEVLNELLDLGVPVFVEKPLAEDPGAAAALAARAPDRLFVMHKWRHHPGVEALASIARSGELGGVS